MALERFISQKKKKRLLDGLDVKCLFFGASNKEDKVTNEEESVVENIETMARFSHAIQTQLPVTWLTRSLELIHDLLVWFLTYYCITLAATLAMKSASFAVDSTSAGRNRQNSLFDGVDSPDLLKRLEAQESLPSYIKLLIGVLIETKKEISDLSRLCDSILAENKVLREENESLKSQLNILLPSPGVSASKEFSSSSSQTQNADSSSSKIDPDMSRSIVVSGVPEGQSPNSVDRAQHDLHCVLALLNFLGVECLPPLVFRMGVRNSSRPRLLKVILPNDRFQKEVIRLAPRLRFFPHKGVYIRPSLTREERMRRREAHRAGSVHNDNSVANGVLQADSANVTFFTLLHSNYDLVLLTETWLNSNHDTAPLLGIINSQFDVIRCDRLHKKGGGVLVLVRNTLSFEIVFKKSLKEAYEILVVNLFVRACYEAPCLLVGDFNLPDVDWNSVNCSAGCCAVTKEFVDMFYSHNFVQYVKSPTRGSSYLDLIFCNDVALIGEVEVLPPIGSSDHASAEFTLNVSPPTVTQRKWVRDFSKTKYEAIEQYLGNIDWVGSFST
ncbi:hypothetical protein OSTOST_09723, partial [Ostertagia ostertagi]